MRACVRACVCVCVSLSVLDYCQTRNYTKHCMTNQKCVCLFNAMQHFFSNYLIYSSCHCEDGRRLLSVLVCTNDALGRGRWVRELHTLVYPLR